MATNNAINTPLIIPVPRGGTGASSLTANTFVLANGTDALSTSGALADGQLFVGSAGLAPVATTLTAGTGISITNGAGSITIDSTVNASGYTVISASQDVAAFEDYITNGSGVLTLTLPADGTTSVGDIFSVTTGTQEWVIAQPASASIRLGSSTTTPGTGGSLASSELGDSVSLVKIAANSWQVVAAVGNVTVV